MEGHSYKKGNRPELFEVGLGTSTDGVAGVPPEVSYSGLSLMSGFEAWSKSERSAYTSIYAGKKSLYTLSL